MTMSKLPTQYAWLAQEPGPRMLVEALKLYGTTEKSGPGNNPVILAWAGECGIRGYGADSIPWCGLFVAICAHRAGKPLPPNPLWARDWATWGEPSLKPALGDVLVFRRDSGGHVGLYVGEDGLAYHVLGGNQGDAVSIKRIAKNRLIAAQRLYSVGVPDNVRTLRLAASGALSRNEA
jgi:uncharacterized protein (TIGR02594 family)